MSFESSSCYQFHTKTYHLFVPGYRYENGTILESITTRWAEAGRQ